MYRFHLRLAMIAVASAVLHFASTSRASDQLILVQDSFTGTIGGGTGSIAGRTPDTVNVAGNTYTIAYNNACCGQQQLSNAAGNPSPSLDTGFNNSAAIQYSNMGVLATPITLSIDAQMNNLASDNAARGIGLGFYNPLPATPPATQVDASNFFTGIVADPSGRLQYVRNGANLGFFTASAPAGFSSSAFLNLTYTVDPLTGELTELQYGGTDFLSAFMTAFPAPNFLISDRSGFYGSTAFNAALFGRVDNFTVSTTVPEPTSIALWSLVGVGLIAFGCLRVRQGK